MVDVTEATNAPECVVYFVDDDRGMIHSSVQWLTLSGLKVQAFVDPKVLLRTIKPNSPCIVVSDIKMPDLDGMSLMQHLLSKDKYLPVILITGHGDIPLAVEAMKKGAFEFLTKPFSPEKLLETIKVAQARRMSYLASLSKSASSPQNPCSDKGAANSDFEQRLPLKGQDEAPLNALVDDYEKTIIMASLKKHSGDIALVLQDLELPRRTLNAKMKKYGIIRKDFR
jgi:DNA-binding NtrC family response regulator